MGEQHASNILVHDGVTEEAFVATRIARDATLGMPALIVPAIQVNVRAGELPPRYPAFLARAFCVRCANVISSTLGRQRLMGNFLVALQIGLFFALAALAIPNAIEQDKAAGMAYLTSESALA